MRYAIIGSLAVVAVCSIGAGAASADVVTLSDGSRIVGTVGRLGDGKLSVETQFAGTLAIDSGLITRIESEGPVTVALSSGDRLVGPLAWDGQRGIVQTEMGPVPIAFENVEAVWPKGEKSPELLLAEAEIEKARPKWSAILEAGAMFSEGNNEILEAHGRVELQRKTDVDLLRIYARGNYGEQRKRRSVAEVKGGAYYEHMVWDDRLYLYGANEAEYDEFENLDLRYTLAFGPGYYWIRKPEHELKTRAGFGYQHQSFMNGTSTDDAMMDVGLDYRIDIKPWLQFIHSTTYYPTFDSLRDYRLVSESAVLFPIGDSDVWKFKLGALYQYDPIPAPGFESLDQTYYGSVVWEIK